MFFKKKEGSTIIYFACLTDNQEQIPRGEMSEENTVCLYWKYMPESDG